jgi:hypothetical protein
VLLAFKEKFRPLIRQGRKTQTLRLWKKCPFQPGQVIMSPKLGKVKIISIERVLLSNLSEKDAFQEGFDALDELIKSIKEIYSLKRIANVECFKIRFAYLGKKEVRKEVPVKKVTGVIGRQLRLVRPF